jgi:hypothetical protein
VELKRVEDVGKIRAIVELLDLGKISLGRKDEKEIKNYFCLIF